MGNSAQILDVSLDDSAMSCDSDGALDRDERGLLKVKVRNIGTGALTGATVTVSSSTPGLRFPSGASWPVPTTPGFGTATIAVPVWLEGVSGAVSGRFTIVVAGTTISPNQVSATADFRLNFDFQAANSRGDDVEAPQSAWTAGADPLLDTGSPFRRYQSTATQHFWFGPNPVVTADTWLLSPPLQVGATPLRVSFNHRYDFEHSSTEQFDGAVIEVSTDDGLTWTDVGSRASPGYTGTLTTSQNLSTNPLRGRPAFVGQSARYPAFNNELVDLGTSYANQTIRLRFRIGGGDTAGTPAKGWELDDLQFTGITNTPFSSLVADPNRCSNRPPVATVGPDLEVPEGQRVALVGQAVDPEGDPVTLSWVQTAGPLGVVSGTAFTTPEVTSDTRVTLELTASDGRASSAPARAAPAGEERQPRAGGKRAEDAGGDHRGHGDGAGLGHRQRW